MAILDGTSVSFYNAVAIGAWIAQLLELFNGVQDEIEYIWRTPTRTMTYLYAFSRYFPLCAQAVILIINHQVRSSHNLKLCIIEFAIRGVAAQLGLTCLETILAIRVHALYQCSLRIGCFIVAILLIGTAFEVAGILWTVISLQPHMEAVCTPKDTGLKSPALFAVGCGLIQSTFLVMTLGRVMANKTAEGWVRMPVVSLMVRDGILTFVLFTLVITIIMTELWKHGLHVWTAAQSWIFALISIAGCRLIMSMRTLGAAHPPIGVEVDQSYRLTTFSDGGLHISEPSGGISSL